MRGASSESCAVRHPLAAPDRPTIVTGLPRAGTSLLMQMLAAAGLEIAQDAARTPDVDNPRGYFELSAVKRIREDASFLSDCRGRVVKIVVPLVRSLPSMLPARVVLVERAIEEVLASQRAMLGRRRTGVDEPDDAALGRALSAALETTRAGLAASPRVELFSLSHRALLEQTPRAIASLVDFLAATADPRRPEIPSEARVESTQHRDRGRAEGGLARLRTAMEGAVDRSLYRQRREAPSGGG